MSATRFSKVCLPLVACRVLNFRHLQKHINQCARLGQTLLKTGGESMSTTTGASQDSTKYQKLWKSQKLCIEMLDRLPWLAIVKNA